MASDLIPPTPPGSDHSAARAFARIGWLKVWATLYGYATGTLGLPPIGARRAGLVDAAEVVNMLSLCVLAGTLPWSLPEHATDPQIVGLACVKLSGMHWTLERRAARTVYDDALDERPDPGPDALARLMAKRGLVDLPRLFEHDAEASVYLREMLKEETRPEIVSTLGWPVERAKVVQKRIVRGVAAHARRMNDDSEDAPPSSGP